MDLSLLIDLVINLMEKKSFLILDQLLKKIQTIKKDNFFKKRYSKRFKEKSDKRDFKF